MAIILMAEDDEDDRFLAREAIQESGIAHELRFVDDGRELVDYLHRAGRYSEGRDASRPALVLLDVNMPRLDGWEALAEIRADPSLKGIPVVMMTTSAAEDDVDRSYAMGANSFIHKPGSFAELVRIMQNVDRNWFRTVSLPHA